MTDDQASDPFEQWANEESDLGDVIDLGESKIEVIKLTDANRAAVLEMVMHNYDGSVCPHCGGTSDNIARDLPLWSFYACPVHTECFDKYERAMLTDENLLMFGLAHNPNVDYRANCAKTLGEIGTLVSLDGLRSVMTIGLDDYVFKCCDKAITAILDREDNRE